MGNEESRAIAVEVIRAELLELTAKRVSKSDQLQFALGVIYMAHKLRAITDQEFDGYEKLISKHGIQGPIP